MKTFTDLPLSRPITWCRSLTTCGWRWLPAYLGRFKGASRYRTESDLRCYLITPGLADLRILLG